MKKTFNVYWEEQHSVDITVDVDEIEELTEDEVYDYLVEEAQSLPSDETFSSVVWDDVNEWEAEEYRKDG